MIATDMMTFIKSDLAVFGVGVALVFCIMLLFVLSKCMVCSLALAMHFCTTAFTASILGFNGLENKCYFLNFIALLLILTISLTVHVLVRFMRFLKNESQLMMLYMKL